MIPEITLAAPSITLKRFQNSGKIHSWLTSLTKAIHAFLGPATFSGVVGSNQVKGTVRVLVCKIF